VIERRWGIKGLDEPGENLLHELPRPRPRTCSAPKAEGFKIPIAHLDRSRPGDRAAGLGLAQGATDLRR